MPIKTIRGLIEDNGTDTIPLHTNDGSTGYRIIRFDIMPHQPGTQDYENVIKIFKIKPTAVPDGKVNFSDNTLLGAGFVEGDANDHYIDGKQIVFDREVFNQDIYITCVDLGAQNTSCNYYIELESMKLDLNENTLVTLKDIRNSGTQ